MSWGPQTDLNSFRKKRCFQKSRIGRVFFTARMAKDHTFVHPSLTRTDFMDCCVRTTLWINWLENRIRGILLLYLGITIKFWGQIEYNLKDSDWIEMDFDGFELQISKWMHGTTLSNMWSKKMKYWRENLNIFGVKTE